MILSMVRRVTLIPAEVPGLPAPPKSFSAPIAPKGPAYEVSCVPYPKDWSVTTEEDCKKAARDFQSFLYDSYTVYLKNQYTPSGQNHFIAPTYFVENDCCFTFYLLNNAIWDTLDRASALIGAAGVLDQCAYFGEVQVGVNVKIQLMDGKHALDEAMTNGNPVFPFKHTSGNITATEFLNSSASMTSAQKSAASQDGLYRVAAFDLTALSRILICLLVAVQYQKVAGLVPSVLKERSAPSFPPLPPPPDPSGRPRTNYNVQCDPYDPFLPPLEFEIYVAPECQTAWNYFNTFTLSTYNLIKKGSGQHMGDNTLYAPTYFVSDACAFTFYLIGDSTSASIDKAAALTAAEGVISYCAFYGQLQLSQNVKVQVMDGADALKEAAQNGNPVYPPQLIDNVTAQHIANDTAVQSFRQNATAQPEYFGGAKAPFPVPFNCDTYPSGYDAAEWSSTVGSDCNKAWDYFAQWSRLNYTLIAEGGNEPQNDTTLFAPTYFIANTCAFTFSLKAEVHSQAVNKADTIIAASGVVSSCGYFGNVALSDVVSVRVMDSAQALKDVGANGAPVFPRPTDSLLLNNTQSSNDYGGAQAPNSTQQSIHSVTQAQTAQLGTFR
ncbi:uncharacterized protein KY384_008812 [Bacidia gigantensis]|uniref:uncharacterized protein n=1 Tax=Bacidia gigantensis TaxID=2732470 RepID=UPI001D03D1C9|nr:uncharacterized protein KY384_008812 [Bacidia gigantensis]KAG8526611.1 hypothetical protein KY384_008812 [Bacidia gigantensis]